MFNFFNSNKKAHAALDAARAAKAEAEAKAKAKAEAEAARAAQAKADAEAEAAAKAAVVEQHVAEEPAPAVPGVPDVVLEKAQAWAKEAGEILSLADEVESLAESQALSALKAARAARAAEAAAKEAATQLKAARKAYAARAEKAARVVDEAEDARFFAEKSAIDTIVELEKWLDEEEGNYLPSSK